MTETECAGFGGGCHWCTEAVFQALAGVETVAQGFIRSDAPADTWSEAVEIVFDPHVIDLASLIEVHLRTHASTSAHSMRGKYRSAVYTVDEAQQARALDTLAALAPGFDAPLVTQALPLRGFKASDARFHDYYASDPERPFCRTYIDPKLAVLRERFARRLSVTQARDKALS